MSVTEELDVLIAELDKALAKRQMEREASERANGADTEHIPDVLDIILNQRPRQTGVQALRNHEAIRQFRQELVSGLVSTERMSQVFGLLSGILNVLLHS